MPRKKTTDQPISNLEVKAKKPATSKNKTAKPKADSLNEELASVLGEDVSLVFRAPSAKAEAPKAEAKAVVAAPTPAVERPKPARGQKAKAVEPDSDEWDADLPIPQFRTRNEKPQAESRPARQAETQAKQPQARLGKRRGEASQKPTEPEVETPRFDDEGAAPMREYEPTESFEFEDEGRTITVNMRERVAVEPKETTSRTRFSNQKVSEPPAKPEPEKVVIPPRALIDIPEDAPQIVLRNGVPTLVRESRVYPNFWFYAAPPDEDRLNTVLEEIRQASEAGLHVFVIGVEAVCDQHHFNSLVEKCRVLLARIVKVDSEAQVVFHLDLVAPKGWEIDFPEGVYRDTNGDLAEPSLSDDKFWANLDNLIRDFSKNLLGVANAEHILGLDLDKDGWSIRPEHSFDISVASKRKFKEWVRERYQGDVVLLRASWFDGSADFESIRIPDISSKKRKGRLVEGDRKERPVVDYFLFLSDLSARRIADLAYAVKESSEGRFIVGTRYGKTFQNYRPGSGQLSLGKILRTPEIDFISASPSNRNRQASGVSSFESPVDSYALNGKLFISLEDFKTSLSNRPEPELGTPTIRTPQGLEAVHRRGFGASCSHQTGICWSDQWGNGWLTAASVWERAKALLELSVRSMSVNCSDPDVAVFIDERALGYLVDTECFGSLIEQSLESIGRAGVSYGLYLLSDLTHRVKFPECKVYMFLNAWDIRPDLRSAIKQRLHKDGKLLFWVYSAGMFDNGRESLERAREVTGIAIRPQPIFSRPGTGILDRRNVLAQAFPGNVIQSEKAVEPTYFAVPEDGAVIGEYTQTGLPSFVLRDISVEESKQTWSSAFLGETTINSALVRALAQKAGAHVWSFHEDVIHVRPPFLTVHCTGDGQRTIALPGKWSAYNLLTAEWVAVDSTNIKFSSPDGVTHMFLIGTTDEIRQILEANPRSLLRMAELPARESNIRMDISSFDVPIMRLGEWASENDVEDSLDEWFLRPQDDEPYEEDASLAPGTVQRTTGRRRSKRDRRQRKASFADQVDFDPTGEEKLKDKGDVELNILFRKRD
ncbi:MAG: hypothetical protein JST12_12175 [Armatimonadetes bacterium]|nr:hypothetical protein [Armatimonadota bacterium]